MREHGIAEITRRKRRTFTKPDQGAVAVPDLIRREFTAPMLGLKLTGDITCLRTNEGWLYLATGRKRVTRIFQFCRWLLARSTAARTVLTLALNALSLGHLGFRRLAHSVAANTTRSCRDPLAMMYRRRSVFTARPGSFRNPHLRHHSG